MSPFYSNHFTSDGVDREDLDLASRNPVEVDGSFIRYKRVLMDLNGLLAKAGGDLHYLLSVKSSDRIIAAFVSSDGGEAAGAINLDLTLTRDFTSFNDAAPSMPMQQFFSNGDFAPETGFPRTEFLTKNSVQVQDRGNPLWKQIVDRVAAFDAFSVDPIEEWAIVTRCGFIGMDSSTYTVELYIT